MLAKSNVALPNAVATVTGMFYLFCSVLALFFPSFYASLVGDVFHWINPTALLPQPFESSRFFRGLLLVVGGAWLLTAVAEATFYRFTKRSVHTLRQ